MSADNGYAVWEDNGKWKVAHIFMSPFTEDCQYLNGENEKFSFDSREEAIVFAHDLERKSWSEYGVSEYTVEKEPCGRCWVCVNKRGIVDPELTICAECENPIPDSSSMVGNANGWYHSGCYSRYDID